MKRVRLQFTSLVYLSAFRKSSGGCNWEINLASLSVQCDCSLSDIRLACSDYQAVVLSTTADNRTVGVNNLALN